MERQFQHQPRFPRPRPVGVIVYGLGAIGMEVTRALLARPELRLAGAVDVDPGKIGRDVGELLGQADVGVTVQGADAPLADLGAVAAIHTTGSFFPDVLPQIEQLVGAGLAVISSTEELAYPFLQHPELSRALDALARSRGVAVVGVGVNPGFVMDALPVLLAGACRAVRAVRVTRVVDAARRRGNLQRKIGAGMTHDEFARAAATGRFGHVGLVESAALIAEGLGWQVERVTEALGPVAAQQAVATEFVSVDAGRVAGIHQTATAWCNGEPRVLLDLTMRVGHPDPHDAVAIDGDPPLEMRLAGGVAGDVATVGRLLNAVPLALAAGPGLLTVLDLPPAARPRTDSQGDANTP